MPVSYLQLVNEITAPMPPMPVAKMGEPPFVPLRVPLESATVMLVNSAGVHLRDEPPFQFVDDLSFRRLDQTTERSRLRPCHPSPIRRPGRIDVNVVYPYERLAELANHGVIGRPTGHHASMLGAIKKVSRLMTELGPAIAADAHGQGADLVMLVPLCPACHQAIGLLARAIEKAGIPTVSVTGARDITELVRPPRAAYLDFPLGYSLGHPDDAGEQREICRSVLELATTVTRPGDIVDLPYRWPEAGWEEGIVEHYWKDRETVIGQRSKEFGPDGTHLAAKEVEAVEAMG